MPQIVHLWTGQPSERLVANPACAYQHEIPLWQVPECDHEVHALAHEDRFGDGCWPCWATREFPPVWGDVMGGAEPAPTLLRAVAARWLFTSILRLTLGAVSAVTAACLATCCGPEWTATATLQSWTLSASVFAVTPAWLTTGELSKPGTTLLCKFTWVAGSSASQSADWRPACSLLGYDPTLGGAEPSIR